jgi:hypothetical protein
MLQGGAELTDTVAHMIFYGTRNGRNTTHQFYAYSKQCITYLLHLIDNILQVIHKLSKIGHNGSWFMGVISLWTDGFSTFFACGWFLYSFKHPQRKKSITDRSNECTGYTIPDIWKCHLPFILIHATYSTNPLSLNRFWDDITLRPSWCAHTAPYPHLNSSAGQKFILKCVSWICTSLYMYMARVPLWRQ